MSVQPEALTFEQFAARNGASRQDVGDAGNHRRGEKHSDATWQRALDVQRRKDMVWTARRAGLRQAYASAVMAGDIIAPSLFDKLLAGANGMPELEATQACRRLLEKKFGADQHGDSIKSVVAA